jgi:hypothetical protein
VTLVWGFEKGCFAQYGIKFSNGLLLIINVLKILLLQLNACSVVLAAMFDTSEKLNNTGEKW